jgi:hypothetical protein
MLRRTGDQLLVPVLAIDDLSRSAIIKLVSWCVAILSRQVQHPCLGRRCQDPLNRWQHLVSALCTLREVVYEGTNDSAGNVNRVEMFEPFVEAANQIPRRVFGAELKGVLQTIIDTPTTILRFFWQQRPARLASSNILPKIYHVSGIARLLGEKPQKGYVPKLLYPKSITSRACGGALKAPDFQPSIEASCNCSTKRRCIARR